MEAGQEQGRQLHASGSRPADTISLFNAEMAKYGRGDKGRARGILNQTCSRLTSHKAGGGILGREARRTGLRDSSEAADRRHGSGMRTWGLPPSAAIGLADKMCWERLVLTGRLFRERSRLVGRGRGFLVLVREEPTASVMPLAMVVLQH